MYQILLVEDDVELSELLVEYLELYGFAITMVHNGRDAIERLGKESYDLIILDVMLPQRNGFEVLRHVRQFSQTPVIMLTARGDEIDRIVGLEMGADDYLPKPCNPAELMARMKAILRRSTKSSESVPAGLVESELLKIDDLELFKASQEVFCQGKPLDLTGAEYNILYVLLKNVGQVVKKETLTEQALSRNMTEFDRSVDVHISKLRTKLGLDQQGNERIKTVRGVGYLYRLPRGT